MWLFMAVVCVILKAVDSQESLSRRHLNPQEFMTISEIIQYWGYPSEEYEVLTADGYYLQVNRIPFGVHSPGNTGFTCPHLSLLAMCATCVFVDKRVLLMARRKRLEEATLYRDEVIMEKSLIAFSVMPQLGQKVKLFVCFAPVYTAVGIQGPFLLLLAPDGAFTSRADVYVGIYPDFTSVKTVVHWSQVVKSHEFKYFDYGCKNRAVYNMATPPFYKIEDMIVPTAVWSGGKDKAVTTKDVERLLPRIKCLVFL
ncbi:hypothetical protein lerEdw1_020900 [Lerista edwardsae]|nr:hypothetical protein lerEdw1_020900 [Lerista edwardsae]